jgi:hypothetical protein
MLLQTAFTWQLAVAAVAHMWRQAPMRLLGRKEPRRYHSIPDLIGFLAMAPFGSRQTAKQVAALFIEAQITGLLGAQAL